MAKVIIKKGKKEIISNDLASISHTHDGIVFNFVDQSYYYVVDQRMPIEVKERLIASDQNISNGNLIIDLNNYQQPVYADLT